MGGKKKKRRSSVDVLFFRKSNFKRLPSSCILYFIIGHIVLSFDRKAGKFEIFAIRKYELNILIELFRCDKNISSTRERDAKANFVQFRPSFKIEPVNIECIYRVRIIYICLVYIYIYAIIRFKNEHAVCQKCHGRVVISGSERRGRVSLAN